ncbi:DUF4446 family protein [Pseudobacteroides cellulosolvens]|uniref:DUF4446 domain-containing protein n=1 Tax=Pseudobacteroides cellulosolvens ATCC 35603 = DSM 2933 TaxID=398512 RepID=A0A0L6JVL5_9FIRM|nr:DUF4446 family protein [Pseudobacteroides cellulosolvens]KNY29749.1 hypothetical protein Bccel_5026 [Pseudobacteroides cellulosolvens ATCC 35603 = DSM 2933]
MDFSLENLNIETIIIFSINFVFSFILFLLLISNRSKVKKLKRKYNRFMSLEGERNLEELLNIIMDRTDSIISENKEIDNRITNIDKKLVNCIHKVGVIRYNAFENMGSDLSYSIALLDSNDNGIIISGIYSRDSSSTYAKPIINGNSKYMLSEEEVQALNEAKKN